MSKSLKKKQLKVWLNGENGPLNINSCGAVIWKIWCIFRYRITK